MQTNEEAQAFDLRMREIADLYQREHLSKAAKRQWWVALDAFPWSAVDAALTAHIRTSAFFPRPADIIKRLIESDGRPPADEAWSTALLAQDEQETVQWTRETRDAWMVARPVLAIGDKIGARRTFLAAYERAVTTARQRLQPAEWSVSIGADAQRRSAVIETALRLGRIAPATAHALLGPIPLVDHAGDVAGLLERTTTPRPGARQFIAAIREGLRQAQEREDSEREALDLAHAAARSSERGKKDEVALAIRQLAERARH